MLTRKSKVLSIVPKRNKKNIYVVTSSSGKTIEISKEILQSESLFEGFELEESDFEKIVISENYYRVKEAGLILLSYRMRSKKELCTRLIKKGFSLDIINDVMVEFEKKDWINDQKFGLAFSKDQVNRHNIGPIALKYKLKEYLDSLELIEKISNSIYSELDVEIIISKIFKNILQGRLIEIIN